MPKLFTGTHPSESRPSANNSVPKGHRAKCRTCGAVDNVAYRGGNRRSPKCGACGSTVARRRAPRATKIISYVVLTTHDGNELRPFKCADRFTAETHAITFCERGPVARTRIAMVVELLDDVRTGNVRMLTYSNYRGRRGSMEWTGGCGSCKGRGTLAHRIPGRDGDKSTVRFVACVSCQGLGGQLNREVNYKRLKVA